MTLFPGPSIVMAAWTMSLLPSGRKHITLALHNGYQELYADHLRLFFGTKQDDPRLMFYLLKETAWLARTHTWPQRDDVPQLWHHVTVGLPDRPEGGNVLPDWAIAWADHHEIHPRKELAALAARAAVAFAEEHRYGRTASSRDWAAVRWNAEADFPSWIAEAYNAEHGTGAAARFFYRLVEDISTTLRDHARE